MGSGSPSYDKLRDGTFLQTHEALLQMGIDGCCTRDGIKTLGDFSDELCGCSSLLKISDSKQSYDGNSDHRPLRGILKKPAIPPRTSSLHVLNRSRSSENLRPQINVEEIPSRRRASSISLPPGTSRSPSIPPAVLEDQSPVQELLPTVTQAIPGKIPTPKLITPLSTPHVAPQTSLQPATATPVLIIPGNDNPFDFATTLEEGHGRRTSTGSIDPFAEEEEYQGSAKGGARNLLGASIDRSGHPHVGWKTDFLTPTPEEGIEDVPGGYSRRRSSSLPDLPGAVRVFKSVKGRRATPWVHNIGINGATAENGKGKRVKLAFPTLKRLSDASVKSTESGYEVWFDALEEQEEN
ncbi:hypothetical protein TWF481_008434 [Arthrobotrys musiformis]|uniref:Uncharacterized protein n=1 Tax=Arthrobotrys musiformis TaxID=47236 RepID=A0AAV9W742_9PEZI